jgi:hypothetical protein
MMETIAMGFQLKPPIQPHPYPSRAVAAMTTIPANNAAKPAGRGAVISTLSSLQASAGDLAVAVNPGGGNERFVRQVRERAIACPPLSKLTRKTNDLARVCLCSSGKENACLRLTDVAW